MTNPTDPRIEAAARAWIQQVDRISLEKTGKAAIWDDAEILSNIRTGMEYALKAAEEAAWLPIEGVKDCPLAALIEQGSGEGPYIGSCRDGVWCDGLDMVEPTHYMPLPAPPEATP